MMNYDEACLGLLSFNSFQPNIVSITHNHSYKNIIENKFKIDKNIIYHSYKKSDVSVSFKLCKNLLLFYGEILGGHVLFQNVIPIRKITEIEEIYFKSKRLS